MSNKTAYPLYWPEGWPRTKATNRRQSLFGRFVQQGRHSMAKARDFLASELARLGAREVILSTNVELRLDGLPYANRTNPADPGAAVFFKLKGKGVALACDKWNRVECNVWAIAKHIEALRGQDRWGVGSIEQAFRGYMALPESTGEPWHQVLAVPINADEDMVKNAYRILAKKHHPDAGGDPEMFKRLIRAMEDFQRLKKQAA